MKAYEINKPPDAAIKHIVTHLLEQQSFSGVMALSKKNTGEYAYALISHQDQLDHIDPLYPLMPANAGKLVSRITMIERAEKPLAVILRPCELRALYELVKLEQAQLENLLFISFVCGGVFPISSHKKDREKKYTEYWNTVHSCNPPPGIRETCKICEEFIPETADIVINVLDNDISRKTTIFTQTPAGQKVMQKMNLKGFDKNLDSPETEAIQRQRADTKQEVFRNLQTEKLGWNRLINLFGRCIDCHACSSVCPICYCKLCYIDSAEKDTAPLSWEQRLRKQGSLRIPDSTVMYHLVRLLHVGIMCVGCGMCSDVCPVDIPIASIFTKFGHRVQKDMQYTPGKDITHKMPLADVNPQDFVGISQDAHTQN